MQRALLTLSVVVLSIFVVVFVIPVQYLGIDVEPNLGLVEIPGAEMEYYDIQGHSGQDLWREVRQKGPLDGTADAVTSWSMQWQYLEVTSETGCTVVDPKVTYTIKVVMPYWRDPQTAPYALITGWRDYLEGVRRHEANHVNIVLDNMDRVKQAIVSAPCGEAGTAAQKAYDEIAALQEEYDAKTDSGKLEGIYFPY